VNYSEFLEDLRRTVERVVPECVVLDEAMADELKIPAEHRTALDGGLVLVERQGPVRPDGRK